MTVLSPKGVGGTHLVHSLLRTTNAGTTPSTPLGQMGFWGQGHGF